MKSKKSDWLDLLKRLKFVVDSGQGTPHDLCSFVDVAPARYWEWISGKIEPKAQKTLMILKWVEIKEREGYSLMGKAKVAK